MSKGVALYDQERDGAIGRLTEAQFKVLTTYIRLAGQDVSRDRDHRITRIMLDVMEREAQRVGAEARNLPDLGQPKRGARSEARAGHIVEVTSLLRQALGDRAEMTIRWQKV
jgi:hypothetical protein